MGHVEGLNSPREPLFPAPHGPPSDLMGRTRGLKRELLRSVVEANVEDAERRPRGSLRRERQRRSERLRRRLRLSAVTTVVAAGASVLLLAGATTNWWQPIGAPAVYRSAILEDGDTAALQPVDRHVIPLSVHKVVLDPGHGGKDPGAITAQGLYEKDLTLDIARRLSARLISSGLDVHMTRNSDVTLSLEQRVRIANSARADLFVSIHVNSIPRREARGVETFYLGPTNDPFLTSLAAAENEGSGYSVADYRSLLDGIYAGVRQEESRQLAGFIQQALYRSLLTTNSRLEDRGVKTAPFVVLIGTEMPAVLAEVSCLSNSTEARLLTTPKYRERISTALFRGIWEWAHTTAGPIQKGQNVQKGTAS